MQGWIQVFCSVKRKRKHVFMCTCYSDKTGKGANSEEDGGGDWRECGLGVWENQPERGLQGRTEAHPQHVFRSLLRQPVPHRRCASWKDLKTLKDWKFLCQWYSHALAKLVVSSIWIYLLYTRGKGIGGLVGRRVRDCWLSNGCGTRSVSRKVTFKLKDLVF